MPSWGLQRPPCQDQDWLRGGEGSQNANGDGPDNPDPDGGKIKEEEGGEDGRAPISLPNILLLANKLQEEGSGSEMLLSCCNVDNGDADNSANDDGRFQINEPP